MPSPELRRGPEPPPPPPSEQTPKFSFLKNVPEVADADLQEFKRGTDRQEILRQLNILAGTERVLPNHKDASRINKEIRKAEQLMHVVAEAIHHKFNHKNGGDFAIPMARLNNRLVSLMIGMNETEIRDQVSRIVRRLQRIFSEEHPHDVGKFLEFSRGMDKGIVAATRFLTERGREKLPENTSRRLFYNNSLDAKYGIDLIELDYVDADGEISVDEMRLIQIKSSAQREETNGKVLQDHLKFMEDFMARMSEYEAQYRPSVEFKDDEEQIAFNESLVELQNTIEIAGFKFLQGEISRNQLASEIISVFEKSRGKGRSPELASVNKLPIQDKMWFIENYINGLKEFILEPRIEEDLEQVAQLIRREMSKGDYRPPKAAAVSRISSNIWAPGDPLPGNPANNGRELYSSKPKQSGQNPDKPILIHT